MALKDITDKVVPVWQALKGIATGSKIISTEWNTVIENVAERTQFLRRRGVCDWDSTLSYAVGDFVQVAGVVYKALTTSANKAPASNPANWERCLMVAGEIAYTNAPEADGTASAGIAGKYSRGDHVHPTDDTRAPVVSPALTGNPTAPTAAVDTSTTQVATTAFVTNQASATTPVADGTAAIGSSKRYARADHVHPTDASRAPLASPALTGTPTAPTATDGTNTTQIANTAFVQSAVGGYLLKSGQTGGTVTLTDSEASNPIIAVTGTLTRNLTVVLPETVKRLWAVYNATSGAYTVTVKLASGTGVTVAQGKRNLVYTDGSNVYDGFNDFENIALTGTSTAITAAVDTSTTQVASTEFVTNQAASTNPIVDGTAAVGTSKRYARADHVHPTDTSRAPLASPALTGIPTMPTATASTNTTQGASTAFVHAAITLDRPYEATASNIKMNGTAAVGTLATVARGDHTHPTDTTRAAVASFLSSKVANGYQKLEGGLIIQWGVFSYVGTSGMTGTVCNLPIVFPNAGLQIVVSDVYAGVNPCAAAFENHSQIRVWGKNVGGPYVDTTMRFVAIGY